MKSSQFLIALLLVIGTSVAAGHALSGRSEQATASAAATSAQASGGTFPKDIYADTGNRLPAIKRDALDDAGCPALVASGHFVPRDEEMSDDARRVRARNGYVATPVDRRKSDRPPS